MFYVVIRNDEKKIWVEFGSHKTMEAAKLYEAKLKAVKGLRDAEFAIIEAK